MVRLGMLVCAAGLISCAKRPGNADFDLPSGKELEAVVARTPNLDWHYLVVCSNASIPPLLESLPNPRMMVLGVGNEISAKGLVAGDTVRFRLKGNWLSGQTDTISNDEVATTSAWIIALKKVGSADTKRPFAGCPVVERPR